MDTPALDHLLGAYFHQDWRHDGTEEEVVQTFLADEPELAPGLLRDVKLLLGSVQDDDELGRVLLAKRSNHLPAPNTGGHREFVERIARAAQAKTA